MSMFLNLEGQTCVVIFLSSVWKNYWIVYKCTKWANCRYMLLTIVHNFGSKNTEVSSLVQLRVARLPLVVFLYIIFRSELFCLGLLSLWKYIYQPPTLNLILCVLWSAVSWDRLTVSREAHCEFVALFLTVLLMYMSLFTIKVVHYCLSIGTVLHSTLRQRDSCFFFFFFDSLSLYPIIFDLF